VQPQAGRQLARSLLHFHASPFGRFSALVRPKLSTPRFIAPSPKLGDGADLRIGPSLGQD